MCLAEGRLCPEEGDRVLHRGENASPGGNPVTCRWYSVLRGGRP